MQKRTLELTQDEINLILRALRIAEKTFDNFRQEYISKMNDDDAITETESICDSINLCIDLRFDIKEGKLDVKK